MIRIVSSLSKLVKFSDKEVIIDEGQPFNEILFFVKGEANIYKKLKLESKHGAWEETILMGKLSEGEVFGEKYYMDKESSGVKIVGVHRGEFIRVSFRDNISTIETPLYKRIRQNASRFPTDQELLEQYKLFLMQKCKQL
jgi:CRP-like cAMP-binding protein